MKNGAFWKIPVLCGLLVAGSIPARAQWKTWTDPSGAMEVQFPGAFETGSATVRSKLAVLAFAQASAVGLKGMDFYAYAAAVDRSVGQKMETARLRAEETVKNLSGAVVSMDILPVDDGWCVQFLAALPQNKSLKGRIYLFEGVLAELWAISETKQVSKPEMNAFLDSFKWKRTSRDRLKTLLSATGLQYSADEDNDFKVAYRFAEEKRSQVAFITTFTSPAHNGKVIEIWSPVYQSRDEIPGEIANDLLNENSRITMGSFQTLAFDDGRRLAVFSVILEMNAPAQKLKEAILHALINADDKESQLDTRDVY